MSELTGRQIRALILLLILAPLIPTILMLRLMISSVRAERVAAQERTRELYQTALRGASSSLAVHLEAQPITADVPRQVLHFYERAFDKGVRVRIADSQGRTVAGAPEDETRLIAELPLDQPRTGWKVELLRSEADPLDAALTEQITTYSLVTGIAVVANLGIAGLAGYALSRQLRLHELKNSSLATVSHELKTPLASMRVLLDTLIERSEIKPGQLHDYLHLLSKENARLTRIVENFLTVAQMERRACQLDATPVSAQELFAAAVDAEAFRIREDRWHLTIEAPPALPKVSVDKEAMTVALANLVDNALKYSADGGEIVLRAHQSGSQVCFDVTDHGPGISDSEQKKIFGRFYQVDQKLSRGHEGSGLGLWIAQSIVKAHGGVLRVKSAEGRGSTFSITLPGLI